MTGDEKAVLLTALHKRADQATERAALGLDSEWTLRLLGYCAEEMRAAANALSGKENLENSTKEN